LFCVPFCKTGEGRGGRIYEKMRKVLYKEVELRGSGEYIWFRRWEEEIRIALNPTRNVRKLQRNTN
jgi:hypothetical protein